MRIVINCGLWGNKRDGGYQVAPPPATTEGKGKDAL